MQRQPGSGNQDSAKSDLRLKNVARYEAKFTYANSFSLQLDELYKLNGELQGAERPAFIIDFRERGSKSLRDRFVVVPFEDFKELHAARVNRRPQRA